MLARGMLSIGLVLASVLCASAQTANSSSSGRDPERSALDRWYGDEYQACDGSTVEIIGCMVDLRDRWDARLNDAYKEMTGRLDQGRRNALRDAQRKWIAYRDANCEFYSGGEGSIARIESAVCDFALTRERAQELEMMVQN